MKNKSKLLSALLSVSVASLVFAEKPYDFRKQLEVVHDRGRRDLELKPAAEEFVFHDGTVIAVPDSADEVLAVAGKDFCDYLDVSMGVSARFATCRHALIVSRWETWLR